MKTVFLTLLFLSFTTLQASCDELSSTLSLVQRLIDRDYSLPIVAKVKTLEVGDFDQSSGSQTSLLQVEEIYQGEIKSKKIKFYIRDEVHSDYLHVTDPEKPWIIVMNKGGWINEEHYTPYGCSTSQLRFDDPTHKTVFGKILSQAESRMDLDDFLKLMAGNFSPKLSMIACSLFQRRKLETTFYLRNFDVPASGSQTLARSRSNGEIFKISYNIKIEKLSEDSDRDIKFHFDLKFDEENRQEKTIAFDTFTQSNMNYNRATFSSENGDLISFDCSPTFRNYR